MKSLDWDALYRVAEALEFDADALDELTENAEVAEQLRDVLSVRIAATATGSLSEGFVEAAMEHLPTTSTSPRVPGTRPSEVKHPSGWFPTLGGALTGVIAASATFFALLATGGADASGPGPLLTIALIAGIGAGVHGSREADTDSGPP